MNIILYEDDNLDAFTRFGGGKATNLAKLSQLKVPVPKWFCLTTCAFDQYIQHFGLHEKLTFQGDPAVFSKTILDLFLSLPLPETLLAAIRQGLAQTGLENSFVAVRSSGTDEDAPGTSFAGQYSSFLYQKGEEAIAKAILKAWASGFSERGIVYRQRHGLPLDNIKVAVVIQKMVNADTAGVAFSRDPLDLSLIHI